ncbi:dihydrofolate reductase [Pedobacter sp. LMG 31464]|uniref:Dihydrofolate reductase n=1 Tax=Pedobacter planticolens TaxID=2679964 RepID=A0A923DYG6_9SPHI|nr:dihydrofolate reductase [Pedobacter planticolens]MBB2145376.1 dihydrofolate reductase [Pedobacter planticolens]
MNKVTIVVAISENNAIGKDNQLLWYLPADLKHFKEITTGGTIIMGRKTYDSIGKPLPNRRNIVITRKTDLEIAGVEVVNSLQEALSLCEQEKEVFIIGGAEIYKHALVFTNRIYLTTVHQSYEADAFFPELTDNEWEEINQEYNEADEKNNVAYTFSTLERK